MPHVSYWAATIGVNSLPAGGVLMLQPFEPQHLADPKLSSAQL
jgi:hypothetical protein